MDTGELRRRILRALEDSQKESAARRKAHDEAAAAYERFLEHVAVPLFRQACDVLKAEGQLVSIESPAGSVRLTVDRTRQTFLELELDRTGARPQVMGRLSLTRGRAGVVVEEVPIAPEKALEDLVEDDVARFLVAEVPKLIG